MKNQWLQTEIEKPGNPFVITPSGIIVEILKSSRHDIFSDEMANPIWKIIDGNVIIFQPDKVRISTHENAN